MPRMNMFIQSSRLPQVVVRSVNSNPQLTSGTGIGGNILNRPMLIRIAGLKSGCSSCGG